MKNTTRESKEAVFQKKVDLVLEFAGTPRHYLYEYPYRADESDEIIAKAERLVRKILEEK